MIRRVMVKGFRAFEDEAFDFESGTTFVVAPNGGGKTTLTRAVSWALFGDDSGVDAKAEIRGDGPATITVELALPDEVPARITRTQAKRGAATLDAVIGEVATTDDDELASMLSGYWGASPQHLASICFMDEHSVAQRSELAPGLDHHLHSIFGIDRLREDLEQARKARRAAEREVRDTKKAAQRPEDARRQDMERLASLRDQLQDAEQRRQEIQWQRQEVRARADLRARWEAFDESNQQRQAALGRLASQVEDLTSTTLKVDEPSLRRALAEEQSRVLQRIDERQRAIGVIEGKLEAAAAAVDDLTSADAECPVCLRPLGEDETQHALAGHAERRAQLEAGLSRLQADSEVESRLQHVRQLQAELAGLPDSRPPSEPRPPDVDGDPVDELEATLEQVTSELVELKETMTVLERRVADDAELLAEQQKLQQALHRLAVAQVAEETFAKTIDIVMQEQVGPLSQAMEEGWKLLMGGRSSLSWEPGRTTLTMGTHDVDYAQTSGGERTILTVMTQLLAIAASTEAKFLWLDEPLEHLDPDHRRLVAAALAASVDGGRVRQIVVSTYEEPLVRRLRDADPDRVRVRYLAPSVDPTELD